MWIVSVTGLWGLTFLITWFASVVNAQWEANFDWRPAPCGMIGCSAALLAALVFGRVRLAYFSSPAPSVRVAGIVLREDLFNMITEMNPQNLMPGTAAMRAAAQNRFAPIVDDLFARSRQEAARGARIFVWREAATPVIEEGVPTVLARAGALAWAEQIYPPVGLVIFRNRDQFPFLENRAVMMDLTESLVWDYHEAYPTPGENTMVEAGPSVIPTVDTPCGRLGAAICYDADFPEMICQSR